MSDNGTQLTCKNCGTNLPPEAEFCPSCGQSVSDMARPWSVFLRETLDELFDLDGRMVQSLRLLLARPGFLSREYLDGRRLAYTPPLRMYLVISLAFFFILPMILPDAAGDYEGHTVSVDLYSKAMFLLLPVFALLLKLFYRNAYYLAHLLFAVHLFSAMFIVFTLLLSIETLADRYLALAALQLFLVIYMTVYFTIALHTVYEQGWGKTIAKGLAILFIFIPILASAIELASHVNSG